MSAASQAITSYTNTVTYFRDLIGRQYNHPEVQVRSRLQISWSKPFSSKPSSLTFGLAFLTALPCF